MKPQLAVFCPLPPKRSGIADYCFEQLPFLDQMWQLSVITSDSQRKVDSVPNNVEVFQLSSWLADKKRDKQVPRLYHLGNNIHHDFVLEESLRRPGVIVLHDYVLHHLIVEMTLARGNEQEYIDIMKQNHGDIGQEIAQQRARCVFTDYQQFLLPMNRSVVQGSLGVIVHSQWAARRLHCDNLRTPKCVIPHHYAPAPENAIASDQMEARQRLGIPQDRLIFMSIGFATPPKRIDMTIRALGRIRDSLPKFEFWLVGEIRDPAAVNQAAREANLRGRLRTTGYIPLDQFQLAIQAADVIVNLRYPTAGETSGTLIRALGMGRPCVVFNYGSFADVPDNAVVKIPLDTQSTRHLESALIDLGRSSELRDQIGRLATRYALDCCSLPGCVQQYTTFLKETLGITKDIPSGSACMDRLESSSEPNVNLVSSLRN